MKTLNFNTAYTYISSLYGITMDHNEFETVGLIAYDKIGNKQTEIKGEFFDTINGQIELPCDVLSIEAVFAEFPDMVTTSNLERFPQVASSFIERYINYWKINESLLYNDGKLLKYTQVGSTLHFDKDYRNVLVLYRANLVDGEGHPYINTKEAEAIAAYCAYTYMKKQAIRTKDQGAAQLATSFQQEWGRLLSRARVPEKVSQNDLDKVLDAMVSMDRKAVNKSYKPAR